MKTSGKCPECGKPMQMYYTLQCFHCKKPKTKNKRNNLFMAMYWLMNNESDFVKDDFWHYLLDRELIRGNDTWENLDGIEEDCDNKSVLAFHKHFPLNKGVLWEISW